MSHVTTSATESAQGLPNELAAFAVSELCIRAMQPTDVPGIMGIESVSFGPHYWSPDSFVNEMQNQSGQYFVLASKKEAAILGYCGCWIILDEAHITTVATHPDCRGKAYGEVLLAHLYSVAVPKGVRWLTLEVRASNLSAQNLYYKYGFQLVGVRSRYYQDNQEDALIMTTEDLALETSQNRFLALQEKLVKDRLYGAYPEGFGESLW